MSPSCRTQLNELDAGDAGFGALTAIYGLGFVGGSLSGSRGGGAAVLKRRFLGGLARGGRRVHRLRDRAVHLRSPRRPSPWPASATD